LKDKYYEINLNCFKKIDIINLEKIL